MIRDNDLTATMKKTVFLFVSAVATGSLLAALDPKEEVRGAIGRLAEKPNYTWTSTTKNNNPPPRDENTDDGQGRGRFRQSQQGPIEAKTVRAGITVLTSTMNEGAVGQVATKNDKAIIKTKDGWKPLEDPRAAFRQRDPAGGDPNQRGPRGQAPGGAQGDLASGDGGQGGQPGDQGLRGRRAQPGAFGPGAGGPGPDGGGGQRGGFGGGGGGFGGGPGGFGQFDPSTFATMRLRSTRLPTVEAQEWLDRVKDLKAAGVGYYVGDLSDAGLRDMMGGGRRGGGGRGGQDNPNPFQPRNEGTKATVKFWTTGGVLTKYETSFQTKITLPAGEAREINIDRTTTTEIRQVGTSRLDLPKDAIAMLIGPAQTAPTPAQRPPLQRSPPSNPLTQTPPAQTGAP